ncbi:MAG: chorismate synthase [Burkholderiaceae bacterium]|nr:chorismate synthase [Burkholderiaceae bacterium]
MSGSTIGKLFTVTNFGESHGPAIGCVVDGCPPGLQLSEEDIQLELNRRRPGTSRHVTQRQETDKVEILSGVYEGQTTGTPIALLIRNIDQKSKDYSAIATSFRPAHADWSYFQKYGIRDPRGGGRSSARLTAPTVASGAIAKKWLAEKFNILIRACVTNIGGVKLEINDWDSVNKNPFFCADSEKIPQLEQLMDEVRRSGDSVGAEVFVQAIGVPAGFGEPIYDKLDADIAHAFMGLNAVKAVAIGDGFDVVNMKGSQNSDEMDSKVPGYFLSNHSGGILGGISTSQPINVRVAIKPTPSIRLEQKSMTENGDSTIISVKGRHDPCVGIRAVPVLESLLAIVLMDHALRLGAMKSMLK